ncbi:MAG: MarR family transcriptional regulator [Armatimonadia bacterium]|nr:MarR family transcriptional regulator [Armatimonadia bacterium]
MIRLLTISCLTGPEDAMLLPRRIAATPEEVEEFMKDVPGADWRRVAGFLGILDFAAAWIGITGDWLEEHDLSIGRFMVLMTLTVLGRDGLAPSEIAERAQVTRATVTGLIDGLEADGLVERRPSIDDRRRILVQLTPAGRRLMGRLLPKHMERMTRVMQALTLEEARELRDFATRMKARTEELADA